MRSAIISMESAPPSYEQATVSNPWLYIAPFLSTSDLLSAVLVARTWHETFSPALWACPTDHLDIEYDGTHDGLARFQQCLSIARLETRALTHTLRIACGDAVYVDHRPTEWLQRLFDKLPNLQALIVRGVPFIDHNTLMSAFSVGRYGSPSHDLGDEKTSTSDVAPGNTTLSRQYSGTALQSFRNLRLLDASNCTNLTASSLGAALKCLSHLMYLDLSTVIAARDALVADALTNLMHLKVLRLRSVAITDTELQRFAITAGRRLLSLDIRDNSVGDDGVNALLKFCFSDESDGPSQGYHLQSLQSGEHQERALDDFDSSLRAVLTAAIASHLTIEDSVNAGMQHLAISGNRLSERSAARLVRCRCLRTLDIGHVAAKASNTSLNTFALLTPLTFLRIDHMFICQKYQDFAYAKPADPPLLQPDSLRTLQTLCLTGIPAQTSNPDISYSIVTFIKGCAAERIRASEHAATDYAVPPGQKGKAATLRRSADNIFALSTIVLEVISKPATNMRTLSQAVTEDTDSEAMWSAGSTDFSFFREYIDEVPVSTSPREDVAVYRPVPISDGSATLIDYDTVGIVSQYRSASRDAHEHDVKLLGPGAQTPGFWDGTIKVIRP